MVGYESIEPLERRRPVRAFVGAAAAAALVLVALRARPFSTEATSGAQLQAATNKDATALAAPPDRAAAAALAVAYAQDDESSHPVPSPTAPSSSSSDDDDDDDDWSSNANALAVARLVEKADALLNGAKFACEHIDFAYCASSSCTRHVTTSAAITHSSASSTNNTSNGTNATNTNTTISSSTLWGDDGDDGTKSVEIAACACQVHLVTWLGDHTTCQGLRRPDVRCAPLLPIRPPAGASPREQPASGVAQFNFGTAASGFLVHSPVYMDILRNYVDGTYSFTDANIHICSAVRETTTTAPHCASPRNEDRHE